MSTSEPSFQSRRPRRLIVAVALAALAIGAGFFGLRSRLALAEPGSGSPPQATALTTPQSMQARTAEPDADIGPGNCEPCLVGVQ